jgi:hypothetical protein
VVPRGGAIGGPDFKGLAANYVAPRSTDFQGFLWGVSHRPPSTAMLNGLFTP